MAAYGQDHTVNEGHVGELEEEEDFYGDEAYAVDQSHTMPGATNHNGQTSVRHTPYSCLLGELTDL